MQYSATPELYHATLPEDKTMESKSPVEAPVLDHHYQINNAIDSLESVIGHIEAVINRIEGGAETDAQKPLRGATSLLEMLHEVPGRISAIESQMHTLLDKIESQLYR